MPAKARRPEETYSILRSLAILVPIFYASYYAIAIIAAAAGGIGVTGNLPFDFNYGFSEPRQVVLFVSFLLMLIVTGTLIFFVVRSTKMAWDYGITLLFFHFILSMIVMLQFPTNAAWWVTYILGGGIMCIATELSIYYLHDMRSIKVDHE